MAKDRKASTKNTTQVTTSTSTELRDIGLTGETAVDLARVIESGRLGSEGRLLDSVDGFVQAIGKGYTQLIGGAGVLVDTAREQSRDTQQAALNLEEQALDVVRSLQPPEDMLVRYAPLFLLGGVAIVMVWGGRGR